MASPLAKAGHQVIAVTAGLRRPTLHQFFQVRNTVGLTWVLVGQATLDVFPAVARREPSFIVQRLVEPRQIDSPVQHKDQRKSLMRKDVL